MYFNFERKRLDSAVFRDPITDHRCFFGIICTGNEAHIHILILRNNIIYKNLKLYYKH